MPRMVVLCFENATNPVTVSRLDCTGDGRLYAQLRDGTCLVMAADPEYTILAENQLGDGDEQFNATPAFDEGRIIRSTKAVYCVENRRGSIFLLVLWHKTHVPTCTSCYFLYRPSCLQPSSQTSFSSSLMMSAGMTTDAMAARRLERPTSMHSQRMDVDLTTPT